MEEPTTSRATNRVDGRAWADSNNVRGQPALGRTAHSRRAVETRHRGVSGQRGEVHGSASPPAVTNVADLPPESRRADRGGGLLRRANRDVSPVVRVSDSGP